jgi:Cu+-exporting ATPase
LENLFRLNNALGVSRVNFARREVSIQFEATKIKLSTLAGLLCSLGYEPALTLETADGPKPENGNKRRWIQIGVAGFALGNIMLFSLPSYLGMDRQSGAALSGLFGWMSLILALPVATYSAADFWRTAWLSLRQRMLTIEVPITFGLAMIYGWSVYEIAAGRGSGYCDSLTGLVFFLLCGRAFQGRVREGLAFDRDYKSFFPLAVTRKRNGLEESATLTEICVGDRLVIRHGELIPADARLAEGRGLVDYSFVTGESASVSKSTGDYLYAGGKQTGSAIEIETIKPVAQSYLASLWDQHAFQKEQKLSLDSLTNRYSGRFTLIVLTIALGAGAFWGLSGDLPRAIKAFASVLIVACPCALALAAPFALGAAQRIVAQYGIFMKNSIVLERLSQVNTIVFDKTGTLTSANNSVPIFQGPRLSRTDQILVCSLARQSTHPYSKRIHECLNEGAELQPVTAYEERPGLGISGKLDGKRITLGSVEWLESHSVGQRAETGVKVKARDIGELGALVCLAIDNEYRGAFTFENELRPETRALLQELGRKYEVALLSGDRERERAKFEHLLGPQAELRFNQSPFDKLHFIERLQARRQIVMMVGDGLNDAGALKQSDVGVAVVGNAGAFSPASDVILEEARLRKLPGLIELARRCVRIVRWSFGISTAYNLAGVTIAATGLLSPVVCAILMPMSSVSVALFACGAAAWSAKRCGFGNSAFSQARFLTSAALPACRQDSQGPATMELEAT